MPLRLARTKLPRDTHPDQSNLAHESTRTDVRRSLKPTLANERPPNQVAAEADSPPDPSVPPSEPDKPPRRTRGSSASPGASTGRERDVDVDERPSLPQGLDILWHPEESSGSDAPRNDVLPPPELFEEALTNLHVTLHPQTQYRAAYVTPAGPPLEPTLALYCPMEGGNYILDETVRELGRRTGAEVLVIDAIELAAGEWGHFGKGTHGTDRCLVPIN